MNTPLKVLSLEDSETDARLLLAALRRAGFEPDFRRVDNEADFRAALDPSLDVIFSTTACPAGADRRRWRCCANLAWTCPASWCPA